MFTYTVGMRGQVKSVWKTIDAICNMVVSLHSCTSSFIMFPVATNVEKDSWNIGLDCEFGNPLFSRCPLGIEKDDCIITSRYNPVGCALHNRCRTTVLYSMS